VDSYIRIAHCLCGTNPNKASELHALGVTPYEQNQFTGLRGFGNVRLNSS